MIASTRTFSAFAFLLSTSLSITDAFLKLDPAQPAMKEIMDLQRASKFIATQNSNYDGIEAAARSAGLIK